MLVPHVQIWFIPTPQGQRMPPTYFSTQSPAELKQDKLLTLIRPHWSLPTEQQSAGGLLEPGQPIPAQASLVVRAAVLSPSTGDATESAGVTHTWGQDTDVESSTSEERWGVIHLAMNSGYKDPKSRTAAGIGAKPDESKVRVELLSGAGAKGESQGEGFELTEGDALFVKGARVGQQVRVKHLAGREAEFLLFDLQRG